MLRVALSCGIITLQLNIKTLIYPMPSLFSVILPFLVGGALIMCVSAILLDKQIDVFSFWGTAVMLAMPPLLTFLIAFV
jgi:hypothetical protein